MDLIGDKAMIEIGLVIAALIFIGWAIAKKINMKDK